MPEHKSSAKPTLETPAVPDTAATAEGVEEARAERDKWKAKQADYEVRLTALRHQAGELEANRKALVIEAADGDAKKQKQHAAVCEEEQRCAGHIATLEGALEVATERLGEAEANLAEAQSAHAHAQGLAIGQDALRDAEDFDKAIVEGARIVAKWREKFLRLKGLGVMEPMVVHGAVHPLGLHFLQAMEQGASIVGTPPKPGIKPEPLAAYTMKRLKDIRRPSPQKFYKPATHPPGQPPEPPQGQTVVTDGGILKGDGGDLYRQPRRETPDTGNVHLDTETGRFYSDDPVRGHRVWLQNHDERVQALLRKMTGEGEG